MYNDDYQQRQRELENYQRENDRRQREQENYQRENDRRQREQENIQRRLDDEREAQFKRDLVAAAEQRKRDLELNARQLKEDLDKNAVELRKDLDKNAVELRKDLDARAEKEREDFTRAVDRNIELERAEVMLQQLSERRKQAGSTNYSLGVTGIISDSISIAAAMRVMNSVNSNENSTFLDHNNVTRTLSDLSQSDIENIYSEIKFQKQSNTDELVSNILDGRNSENLLSEKSPQKPQRPSILDEKWNHSIKITSEEKIQEYRSIITRIPEFRWVTALNSATSNLNVNDWKYPVNLSDDTIFGIGYAKKTNCKIIRISYYKQLESVIEQQGTEYTLKDNIRVILKLYPGVTESEIVDPTVAVQRIPITTDLIDLFRHGDLINFNLKNQPSDFEMTEDKLQDLFSSGLIYEFTRWRVSTMKTDTLSQSKKTGEELGRTVLEYIENLVDGKDWKYHWQKKYGKPPTKTEELRALGPSLIILTDADVNAKEKEEKETLWKSFSFIKKVKHALINRS